MSIPANRALAPFRPFLIVQTDREHRPVIRQVATRAACDAVPEARRRTVTHRFLDHDMRVFEQGGFRFRMRPFSRSGPWVPGAGLPGCMQDDEY